MDFSIFSVGEWLVLLGCLLLFVLGVVGYARFIYGQRKRLVPGIMSFFFGGCGLVLFVVALLAIIGHTNAASWLHEQGYLVRDVGYGFPDQPITASLGSACFLDVVVTPTGTSYTVYVIQTGRPTTDAVTERTYRDRSVCP